MSGLYLKRRFLLLLVIIALASGTATYVALHNLIRSPQPPKPPANAGSGVPPDPAAVYPAAGSDSAAVSGAGTEAEDMVPVGGNGTAKYYLGISNGYVAIYFGNQAGSEVSEITTIPVTRLSPGDLSDINSGLYASDSRDELRRLLEGLGN